MREKRTTGTNVTRSEVRGERGRPGRKYRVVVRQPRRRRVVASGGDRPKVTVSGDTGPINTTRV